MQDRLQKIISKAGICSRRAAEELIKAGKVTLNGEVASLGMSADAETDIITVNGTPLTIEAERTYIMLNKPRGYVTTMSDEQGRKNVSMLVEDAGLRLYPVGRLDMYSEGLLLMTNDGDTAYKLTHPSHRVDKTYHAWVQGDNMEKSIADMSKSMEIDGYKIRPATVSNLGIDYGSTVLSITIHEGRNRQIRKMCDACNLKLSRLRRVSEGELRLGELKVGKWRKLTQSEIGYLQTLL